MEVTSRLPATLGLLGQPLLPDDVIRRKVEEVVSRPEYQLDSNIDPDAIGIWLRFIMWVLQPIIWLFEALDGLPTALRWIVFISLLILLLILITHLVWSFVAAVRGTPRRRLTATTKPQEMTPEDFEQAAADAVGMGDYITAARVLFLASLLRIERAEKKTLRRGVTNRELLRRYRTSPVFEPLGHLVETIESKWYGHETCHASDYERCRTEYTRIIELLQRRLDASAPSTVNQGVRSDAVGA